MIKINNYSEIIDKLPKSGNSVVSHAAAMPTNFLNHLSNRSNEINNLKIIHMFPMGKIAYCDESFENFNTIKHISLFSGSSTKKFIKDLKSEFIPIHFSLVPKYLRMINLDVAILQISRTIDGKVSLGVSVDYGYQAFKSAKMKIGIQNNNMPYTFGDGELDLNEFDFIIQDNSPLHEIQENDNPQSIIYDKISDYVMREINNGANLQLGIGEIPNYTLKKLKKLKNLGIHSEMVSDGIIDLIKNGTINNSNKKNYKGKSVVSFALGSKKLYDFLDLNDKFLFKSVEYVNNPSTISNIDNMISINSALEIDLEGQVNSERINGTQISGVGGQVDFVRSVQYSKGGKSIIAMPSTDSSGKKSRIVKKIDSINSITTSRNDINFVCTEFGMVNLFGMPISKRRKTIMSLKHPDLDLF